MLRSTLTWARAHGRHSALENWRKDWAAVAKARKGWRDVCRGPPSLHLSEFFRSFTGPRELFSRVTQSALGHAFCGEYYARFVPSESRDCPCGSPAQSREHILLECHAHWRARGALYARFDHPDVPKLYGTQEGLEAVADFLHRCSAFKKHTRRALPEMT